MELQDHTHKRLNPLTGEWVLVSPHRTKRPWQGQEEDLPPETRPQYDPKCYLCPGNDRAGDEKNPDYKNTFAFTNDFAALVEDIPEGSMDEDGLLVAESERGTCRVICFSPRHDLTIGLMDQEGVRKVVDLWVDQYRELSELDYISYVQIFENRGQAMGCSNPHPHGQIWSTENVPDIPAKESEKQVHYMNHNGRCLLCDYIKKEQNAGERIIFENDSYVALVPFWAVWPFETMILPKRHGGNILSLSAKERDDLADAAKRMATRFDNLFKTSFPYSMGIHQMPADGKEYPEWHYHIHYYPPLLRSATVRKFMVGFEMLGMPQRDITAEKAADRLRGQSEIHFMRKG